MKKGKNIIINLFAFFLLIMFPNDVFAVSKTYLSVGTDFGNIGGNSTTEATWVGSTLLLEKYIGSTITIPTYSKLTAQYQGRYVLESDILYFLGHAASDRIKWNYKGKNGIYAVGIKNIASDSYMDEYRMIGIGRYNMQKVKLAIFQGCSTAANPNSNLPKYANSRGATVAIGWASDISRSDSFPWIKRFFSYGRYPNTVTNMVNYANSFSYVTSDIKNTRIYGNGGISVFPSGESKINKSGIIIDNRKHIINQEYDININSIQNIKTKIVNIINNKISKDITESDFTIEMAENDNGKIYDLYFMINGIKTNLGYTIFTNKEGTIITDIYDNMNSYKTSTLKKERTEIIRQKLENTIDLNKIKKNTLKMAKAENMSLTVSVINSFKYYNVDEEKMYQITQVKVGLDTDAYSIIDYKTEL